MADNQEWIDELLKQAHAATESSRLSREKPRLFFNEDGNSLEILWDGGSQLGILRRDLPVTLLYSHEQEGPGKLTGLIIHQFNKIENEP